MPEKTEIRREREKDFFYKCRNKNKITKKTVAKPQMNTSHTGREKRRRQ
jgi:hypothetical protein